MSVEGLILRFGVTATRYTRTSTVDAGGAVTLAYTSAGAFVVYLQPAPPREAAVFGAVRLMTTTTAYCSLGSTILTTDRLIYDGRIYEVIGIRTPDLRGAGDALAYQILTLETIEGQA